MEIKLKDDVTVISPPRSFFHAFSSPCSQFIMQSTLYRYTKKTYMYVEKVVHAVLAVPYTLQKFITRNNEY